jgi:acetyl esterase/lipase
LLLVVAVIIAVFISTTWPLSPPPSTTALKEASRAQLTIPYCDRHSQQSIDLYLPYRYPSEDVVSSANPLVIYVHGGGWRSGDKRNSIAEYYGTPFLSSGIAFASVNYRLAPAFHYPTQNNDVSCAIATIASQASQHYIDPTRVILFGDSAGALLISMYTLSTEPRPITIRGVIDFYGTTDLVYQLARKQFGNKNALNYLGANDPSLARRASPVYQPVPSGTPPFLFFHGDKDTVVTRKQAYTLYQHIKSVQSSSRFITVKSAGHIFTRTSTPTKAEIRATMLEFATTLLEPSPPEPSHPTLLSSLADSVDNEFHLVDEHELPSGVPSQ